MPPLVMPYPTPLFGTHRPRDGAGIPGARVVPYLMPGFTDAASPRPA
ncbi:MAG: hypothetical protein U0166_28950 [Acidobacteriota bacterium]